MAFSSKCQCFFSLLFFVMVASPLHTLARDSKFFSKSTNPKPETEKSPIALPPSPSLSPSPSPSSPLPAEQGYGLFGQEDTHQYPPTTIKSDQPNWVKDTSSNNGYHYGTGEKRGMSDTRSLENGRYFYDVEAEKKNNGYGNEMQSSHESSNNFEFYKKNNYENKEEDEEKYKEGYGTGKKQGMSDTRFFEAEKKNNGYGNEMQSSHESSNKNNYENKEEEEEEEEKFDKEGFGRGEKQGMSDTRFLENGRYFYDTKTEKNHNYDGYEMERNKGYVNNVKFYSNNNNNNNEYYEKESSEPEKYGYNGNGNEFEEEGGKGYVFRSTPNKFPGYEFDSMDEYEKYEKIKPHHP